MFTGNIIIGELFAISQALAYTLWIGLAVITIALVILSRTQWGQAKPISKCVALSIFAHILLGCYAYGTKVFLNEKVESEEPQQVVEVSFEEEVETSPESNETVVSRYKNKPWDSVNGSPIASPRMADSLVAPQDAFAVNPIANLNRDQKKQIVINTKFSAPSMNRAADNNDALVEQTDDQVAQNETSKYQLTPPQKEIAELTEPVSAIAEIPQHQNNFAPSFQTPDEVPHIANMAGQNINRDAAMQTESLASSGFAPVVPQKEIPASDLSPSKEEIFNERPEFEIESKSLDADQIADNTNAIEPLSNNYAPADEPLEINRPAQSIPEPNLARSEFTTQTQISAAKQFQPAITESKLVEPELQNNVALNHAELKEVADFKASQQMEFKEKQSPFQPKESNSTPTNEFQTVAEVQRANPNIDGSSNSIARTEKSLPDAIASNDFKPSVTDANSFQPQLNQNVDVNRNEFKRLAQETKASQNMAFNETQPTFEPVEKNYNPGFQTSDSVVRNQIRVPKNSLRPQGSVPSQVSNLNQPLRQLANNVIAKSNARSNRHRSRIFG